MLANRSLWRGVVALVGFVIFWEVCSQMKVWTGIEVGLCAYDAPPETRLNPSIGGNVSSTPTGSRSGLESVERLASKMALMTVVDRRP